MTSPDGANSETAWERLAPILADLIGADGDVSLSSVLRRVVETARSLLFARYAAIGVLDDEGHLVDFVVDGMTDEEIEQTGPLPSGHGILGVLVVDPRPLRLDDISTHPESVGFPEGHPPMTTFLGVPIARGGVVLGNLYFCDRDDDLPFTAADEELAVALASVASVAFENARLQRNLRTRALIGDRERIARDLHDKVVQRLFAAGIMLQATLRMAEPVVAGRIGNVVDEIDEAIREIRTSIFALGPRPNRVSSVRADILSMIDELAPVLRLDIHARFDGPVDSLIPTDIADELWASRRELLTNVARHAQARHVDVNLAAGTGAGAEAVLQALDDGVGPDGAVASPGVGQGLANLATRADRLGGTFALSARAGGGTVADWRVPLPA